MVEMIKEDDKFFSRLLSKETSTTNPSFRVYYGGIPIGVPFIWEAKPGTPKHPNSNNNSLSPLPRPLPPLTPPPSYSSQLYNKKSSSPSKKGRMILQGLFPKMMNIRHRRQISSASSSTTTTTLSSSSSSDSTTRGFERSRSLSSSSNPGGGSLFEFSMNDRDPEEEEEEEEREIVMRDSPRSILCFGFVNGGKKIHRSPSIA